MHPHAQCLFYFTVHFMLSLSPCPVLFLFPWLLSAFMSFVPLSFVLTCFPCFLFLFPSFCCSFPCASFFWLPFPWFCSLFILFILFPSFCCFCLLCPSLRSFFLPSVCCFSVLLFLFLRVPSFFPVSLALLLPPLLFGPFTPEPVSVVFLLVPGLAFHLPCTTRNAKS